MVSREVYGRHVCILQMWSALSYFRLAVEFAALPPHVFALVLPFRRLPFDCAARPLHVFVTVLPSRRLPLHVVAPVLPARLLLVDFAALPEATALDAQNPSPVVTTFRDVTLLSN